MTPAQMCAQAKKGETSVARSVSAGYEGSRLDHVDRFAAFMQEIGYDDLEANKEAITGEKQSRVDWKKVNQTLIGLSDDEWGAAYSILLDGSLRVANWDDAMQDALGWKDGRYQADPSQHYAEQIAKLDSLSEAGKPIVDATMIQLRERLGDEAFNKLVSFAYQHEGGARVAEEEAVDPAPVQTAKATVVSGMPAQR